MHIKQLYKLELGDAVSVSNEPFIYVGHAQIELDGGHTMRWLYDDEGRMLSVAPQDDEIILFEELEDEIESEDDVVVYQGKEYELDYQDAGTIVGTEGEALTDEDDHFIFTDYQTQGGGIIRLIENENTGEATAYSGFYLSDEDITEI